MVQGYRQGWVVGVVEASAKVLDHVDENTVPEEPYTSLVTEGSGWPEELEPTPKPSAK